MAQLDNLGIPESGDGISDVLQEAKWEADYLAKIQDSDGGFYCITYPRVREYEGWVPPDKGDPQVVWPKTSTATAACVAALAQCASSPAFKQAYPTAAASYLQKAQLGWQFLMNAIAKYGKSGIYQKITHYGDNFTDKDELAWAACQMFLATGDQGIHSTLRSWFDPTDPATIQYGWPPRPLRPQAGPGAAGAFGPLALRLARAGPRGDGGPRIRRRDRRLQRRPPRRPDERRGAAGDGPRHRAYKAVKAQNEQIAGIRSAFEDGEYSSCLRVLYRLLEGADRAKAERWKVVGWFNLGLVALRAGEPAQAIVHFDEVLAIGRDQDAEAWKAFATRYREIP